MDTVTQIYAAWELKKAGHSATEIAGQLGRHRATVYRWLRGIRQRGIRGYVAYFKGAKQGRRVRRTPRTRWRFLARRQRGARRNPGTPHRSARRSQEWRPCRAHSRRARWL